MCNLQKKKHNETKFIKMYTKSKSKNLNHVLGVKVDVLWNYTTIMKLHSF